MEQMAVLHLQILQETDMMEPQAEIFKSALQTLELVTVVHI
jgi:hypothetical protein